MLRCALFLQTRSDRFCSFADGMRRSADRFPTPSRECQRMPVPPSQAQNDYVNHSFFRPLFSDPNIDNRVFRWRTLCIASRFRFGPPPVHYARRAHSNFKTKLMLDIIRSKAKELNKSQRENSLNFVHGWIHRDRINGTFDRLID